MINYSFALVWNLSSRFTICCSSISKPSNIQLLYSTQWLNFWERMLKPLVLCVNANYTYYQISEPLLPLLRKCVHFASRSWQKLFRLLHCLCVPKTLLWLNGKLSRQSHGRPMSQTRPVKACRLSMQGNSPDLRFLRWYRVSEFINELFAQCSEPYLKKCYKPGFTLTCFTTLQSGAYIWMNRKLFSYIDFLLSPLGNFSNSIVIFSFPKTFGKFPIFTVH